MGNKIKRNKPEGEEDQEVIAANGQVDYSRHLQEWLDEKGLELKIVAVGKKSSSFSPIEDFMPDTHVAVGVVVKPS